MAVRRVDFFDMVLFMVIFGFAIVVDGVVGAFFTGGFSGIVCDCAGAAMRAAAAAMSRYLIDYSQVVSSP